jgi:hypothetical protein
VVYNDDSLVVSLMFFLKKWSFDVVSDAGSGCFARQVSDESQLPFSTGKCEYVGACADPKIVLIGLRLRGLESLDPGGRPMGFGVLLCFAVGVGKNSFSKNIVSHRWIVACRHVRLFQIS